MQTIIKYQANDGTIFDNKIDCEDYEYSLLTNAISDKIIFFDEDFTILNGELISSFRDSKYIYISPDLKDTVELADAIHHDFGYTIPSRSGYWYYDYDDNWISINDRINALVKWKTIMTMLENKIKE